jgi:hypothetical protein
MRASKHVTRARFLLILKYPPTVRVPHGRDAADALLVEKAAEHDSRIAQSASASALVDGVQRPVPGDPDREGLPGRFGLGDADALCFFADGVVEDPWEPDVDAGPRHPRKVPLNPVCPCSYRVHRCTSNPPSGG